MIPASASRWLTAGAAAAIGAAFASWIAGWRIINPTQIDWLMKLDWRYHFLGWHFFRNEPWHWPPGVVTSYYAPIGTAIGYTDSIPLAAIGLKAFASLLPMPFQYLGLWLVLTFALQGLFGVLITRLWTSSRWIELLGGTLFVLVPTLLGRVGHPALASHWLILWALWMYWREPIEPVGWRAPLLCGLITGLVHPYLAAMTLLIMAAVGLRRVLEGSGPAVARAPAAVAPAATLGVGLLTGWWMSGMFSVSGTDNLASTGLDLYSMNLLGPIAPAGWSSLMPELPLASELQKFEGFQYLGAGILTLVSIALVVAVVQRQISWRSALPLALAAVLSAIYSLSPRVTLGSDVVFDYMNPTLARIAVFRATGRFFWPATYSLLGISIAVVSRAVRPALAAAILATAVALQVVDLNAHYRILRRDVHADQFYQWPKSLESPVWHLMLPHYKRLLLYGPEQCGPAPVAFEHPALLAGIYGLSINAGHLARTDQAARLDYCHALRRDFDQGVVSDDAVYLLNRNLVERFRAAAQQPVVCAALDRIPVCVTAASYAAWNDAAEFR